MLTPTQRILVPLDGTAESNAALPLARTLARSMGASITLLRVMLHDDPEATRYARSTLQRVADELAGSGLSVDCAVRCGRPADEILNDVGTRAVALVVMRTHGRGGIERAVLGSVAERVLSHANVPIVLMRPGERRVTRIETLLVPVDGSPGGAAGLGTAVALAQVSGASIRLLQVSVPFFLQAQIGYQYGGLSYYDAAWDEDSLASAKSYVDALVARLLASGLRASGEAVVGSNIPQTIVDTAQSESADLVVMSTQALTGPARAVLGSVADTVVRSAHCPVMLVHRGQEASADQ